LWVYMPKKTHCKRDEVSGLRVLYISSRTALSATKARRLLRHRNPLTAMHLLVCALPGPTLRIVAAWLERAGWRLAAETACSGLYPGAPELPAVLRALPVLPPASGPLRWSGLASRSGPARREAWQRLLESPPGVALVAPGLAFALDSLEPAEVGLFTLAVVDDPLDSASTLVQEQGLAPAVALALWEAHAAAVLDAMRRFPSQCLRLSPADAPATWETAFSAAASVIASAAASSLPASSATPAVTVADPPSEAAILECHTLLRGAAAAFSLPPGLIANEQAELWQRLRTQSAAGAPPTVSAASVELLRQVREMRLQRNETDTLLRELGQARRELLGYADNARLQARTVEQANRSLAQLVASSTWRLGRMLVEPLRALRRRPPFRLGFFDQPVCPWTGLDAADYDRWVARYASLSACDRAAIRRHIDTFVRLPRFSILIDAADVADADGGPVRQDMISATRTQLYPAWELCVAVVGQPPDWLLRLANADDRIRIVTIASGTCLLQAAFDAASGEWVLPLQHGTLLAEHALYLLARALENEPEAELLYGDEDECDAAGRRRNPWFKPAWNPDWFYSRDCLPAVALRAERVRLAGGFRDRFAPARIRDLVLRLLETEPAPRARHLPFVLTHRRVSVASDVEAGLHLAVAGRAALQEHFERTRPGVQAVPDSNPRLTRVRYPLPSSLPLISLVVPSQCRPEHLAWCREVLEKTDYPNFEYLLVANNIATPGATRHLRRFARDPRVRVLHDRRPFNFSDICNRGVAQAHGEVIGLLNDDLVPVDAGWLREMLRHALRPEVGLVGAMLCYPDESIQHAGVVLGMGIGAGHAWKGLPRQAEVNGCSLALVQEYSAVTAACMVMRREVWDAVGGLDPAWRVAFNDVDFCLRVRQKGYRIVWTPHAALYHLESVSRGDDDTAHKQARLQEEINLLRERWGETLRADPFFNPNLSLADEHYAFAFPPRQRFPWQHYPAVAARIEARSRTPETMAAQDIPLAGWIAADVDILDVAADDDRVDDLQLTERFDLLHNAPYRYVKAFSGRMRRGAPDQNAPSLVFSLADGSRYALTAQED